MLRPPKYYRWSDNDRRFGPFIYARERGTWRPLALVLMSGHDEEDASTGCKLRMSASGHTLLTFLPPIIRPWRRWVDCSKYEWATSEAKGYWDIKPREYGFSCCEGHLDVLYGRQTQDSSTEQRWGKFLPWKQWRHVRTSLYDLNGEHYWTEPKGTRGFEGYERRRAVEEVCPSRTFTFKDFDGEQLTARTRIDEAEWLFGEGWFKWLSVFRAPKVRRGLDIRFSGETGKRKGSWKGGTMGTGINMLPGELHEAAFRRYCAEHEMTFGCEVPPTPPATATAQ